MSDETRPVQKILDPPEGFTLEQRIYAAAFLTFAYMRALTSDGEGPSHTDFLTAGEANQLQEWAAQTPIEDETLQEILSGIQRALEGELTELAKLIEGAWAHDLEICKCA